MSHLSWGPNVFDVHNGRYPGNLFHCYMQAGKISLQFAGERWKLPIIMEWLQANSGNGYAVKGLSEEMLISVLWLHWKKCKGGWCLSNFLMWTLWSMCLSNFILNLHRLHSEEKKEITQRLTSSRVILAKTSTSLPPIQFFVASALPVTLVGEKKFKSVKNVVKMSNEMQRKYYFVWSLCCHNLFGRNLENLITRSGEEEESVWESERKGRF